MLLLVFSAPLSLFISISLVIPCCFFLLFFPCLQADLSRYREATVVLMKRDDIGDIQLSHLTQVYELGALAMRDIKAKIALGENPQEGEPSNSQEGGAKALTGGVNGFVGADEGGRTLAKVMKLHLFLKQKRA